jgi:soluble lytic murein transglycosylase
MRFFIRRLVVFCVGLAVLLGGYLLLQDKLLRAAYPVSHENIVLSCADEFALDPALICAVIRTESSGREDAVSIAGARGLMQITSPTFDFAVMKTDGPITPGRICLRGNQYPVRFLFVKLSDPRL